MTEMYERKEFLIANGMSQLPNSSVTNDLSPYDYFDGGLDTDIDMDFSEARGRRRRIPKKRGFEKVMSYTPIGIAKSGIERFNSPQNQKRRDQKRRQRQGFRQERQQTKRSESQLQNQAVAKISKSAESDAQLLAQLSAPKTPIVEPKPTMSKGTKTGLIIGSIAVAGIIGFVLYKKFKKK